MLVPACSMLAEVKPGGVGDRLDVVMRLEVGVRTRDRGESAFLQAGNGLREAGTEVRVLRGAAVARPPARVHRQFHQVGQASYLCCAFRLAAGQRTERIEVHRFGAPGFQVGVDKREVALLVVGVVVDVLRQVRVELLQRFGVDGISGAQRLLTVLDATELVVLLPQVRLDQLGGREEAEDGGVAGRQGRRARRAGQRRRGGAERPKAGCSSGREACNEE